MTMHQQAADESGRLHGIAQDAVEAMRQTKEGWSLDPHAARMLRARLVLCAGTPEIEWAVRSLLTVAARCDAQGQRGATEALVSIACGATQALAQLGSRAGTASMRRALRRLAEFTGTATTDHIAPRRTGAARDQRRGLLVERLRARPVRA